MTSDSIIALGPGVGDRPHGRPLPPPKQDFAGPGSETILVVEDDDGLRALVRRILQRVGYRLLEAGSGREALAIVHGHDAPIDLVLSDVVLPDLHGAEILKRVRACSATTKTLLMSGHSGPVLVRDGFLKDSKGFIQKPFTPGMLVNKVREVLDAVE